jgi:hypothetical protein
MPLKMRCFERTFRVPPDHRLQQVRSRARAGAVRGVYWEHEEYNLAGFLVARYESFDEIPEAAPRRSGWRKFDAEGRLLARSEFLPAGADEFA